MKALQKLINENYIKVQIKRDEYSAAKASLDNDEFYKNYTMDEAGVYKIIYPSESELPTIILNNINKSLKSIKAWVCFFGILAIISIIASIIFYLNISKLFH